MHSVPPTKVRHGGETGLSGRRGVEHELRRACGVSREGGVLKRRDGHGCGLWLGLKDRGGGGVGKMGGGGGLGRDDE